MDCVQIFNINLSVVIVCWSFKTNKLHSKIVNEGGCGKRTSCSTADENPLSFQSGTDFCNERFNSLVFALYDFFNLGFLTQYLCNSAIPFVCVADSNRHNRVRIWNAVILFQSLHKLVGKNLTDGSRSHCLRNALNFFQRAVKWNVVYLSPNQRKHALHFLLVGKAYGCWRKKIYKIRHCRKLLLFQNIFINRKESRIKTAGTNLTLKTFAVNRNKSSVRVLSAQITCNRIDVVADNSRRAGSVNKNQLRIIAGNSLLSCLSQLGFTAKNNAFLIQVSHDNSRILNQLDSPMRLTNAVHINGHNGTAQAALRRMRNKN